MNTLTEEQKKYIERTREARSHANITQEQVADFLGCARNTYTAYEINRTLPQKHVTKFCNLTHIEEKWLLSGKGSMSKNNHNVFFERLSENLDKLNEENQKELIDFMDNLLRVQEAKDKVKG